MFADPVLENTILSALGKTNGPVSTSDMASLNELSIFSGLFLDEIGNLSGLEHATALTRLTIDSNSLTNAQAIALLTNLESLSIYSPFLSDVSFMSNLWQLTSLDLTLPALSDATPIGRLTNLTALGVYDTPLTNSLVISNLTALEYLSCYGVPLSSAECLRSLPKLSGVTMVSCGIRDAMPFLQSTSLFSLQLDGNPITNLNVLGQLTSVWSLGLSHMDPPLTNLSFFATMTNLGQAFVDGNDLRDLNVFFSMTNLFGISAANNKLTSLDGIQSLTGLGGLNSNDNAIRDLSPLSTLTNLFDLSASNNPLTNAPLNPRAPLTLLHFANVGLTDIRFLSNYPAMDILDLTSNSIADITALGVMTNLGSAFLAWNLITNIAPLTNCTKLLYAEVSYNHIDISAEPNRLTLAAASKDGKHSFIQWNPQFINPVISRLDFRDPQNQTGITVRFSSRANPYSLFRLETSTNLVDWTVLEYVFSGGGGDEAIRLLGRATDDEHRYFRLGLDISFPY